MILVDDGLATVFSMHAAVIALHRQRPAWLVVAAPVGSEEVCKELAHEVHEVVCPLRPEPFWNVRKRLPLVALQEQPACVVTVTVPLLATAETLAVVGLIE